MGKNKTNKIRNIFSIIEFLLLLVIVVGIPAYIFFFQKDLLMELKDVDRIVEILNDNLFTGSLIYLGIMCVQIVISVLPGQVIQMMAGYAFTPILGVLLSIIGTILGSTITYFLAKFLGKDFVHMIFGEEKISEFTHKLNSKKSYIIVFLIYLIPGIPKDMVGYAAGISNMDYPLYIATSTIGRIPGIIGCIIIGEMTYRQNYTAAIIIGAFAAILFIVGIIYRKTINNWLERGFDNYTSKRNL